MQDIRLYDFEFNLLHIEHDIISTNWTIYYNDIGTFEGHFNIKSDIADIALNNQYLVVVQGNYQAIITGKQATETELILYGKTMNWILSRRTNSAIDVTDSTNTYYGKTNIETLSRQLVTNSFNDVSNFVLDSSIGLTDTQDTIISKRAETSENIINLLDVSNAGHKVFYDRTNKKWVFSIYKGTELPLIISKSNKNAYELEYVEDLQEYFSGAYYNQEQPDDSEGNSVDPIETYFDKDTKTGIYRWETFLSDDTQTEAEASLKDKSWSKETTAKTRKLIYGTNYMIGDLVRVQAEFGTYKTTEQKRIIGVNAWFENNNIGEQPIFEEG